LTIAASTIISAINALTLSPALAALILKPHSAHHGAERDALPRPAIALLIGFLIYLFVTPIVAPWFGVTLPAGGHGEEAAHAAHAHSPRAVLRLRWGVLAVGSFIGWLLSPLINRLLARFFDGFNWFFDRATNVYGKTIQGLL